MLKSRYGDQLFHNPDRTWWMQYSPKAGGMDLAVNAGLVRCMTDRQPVLVLRQESDKTSASGARHLFLGLGYVENFDPAADLFRIRGLTFDEVIAVTGTALSEESDELIETALRLESLEEWVPFAAEDRAVYRISRQKRDAAFRSIVLSNYNYTCAVTGQRFKSPRHVEADGAHIIGKDVREPMILGRSRTFAISPLGIRSRNLHYFRPIRSRSEPKDFKCQRVKISGT
jgi:Predicted restriction endonuclease